MSRFRNNEPATETTWDSINKVAQAVKEAGNNCVARIKALVARTAVGLEAARKEINTGVHNVRNTLKQASAEMRMAESFTEAGKIVHQGVNAAVRDIRTAANQAGAHLDSSLTDYSQALKQVQQGLKSGMRNVQSSLNSVMNVMNSNISYRFLKPANETAIRRAYHEQFPDTPRQNDLVFDSDETAQGFFANMIKQVKHFFIGGFESGKIVGYIGPEGTLDTEANARRWYESSASSDNDYSFEYQLQGQPSAQQGDIIDNYIQYIHDQRHDPDTHDSDKIALSTTAAPDSIAARKNNILRFRGDENPMTFFESQAQDHAFIFRSMYEDPDTCQYAVSIGDGKLYNGNYADVMKNLETGYSEASTKTEKNQYFKYITALHRNHAEHVREYEQTSESTLTTNMNPPSPS